MSLRGRGALSALLLVAAVGPGCASRGSGAIVARRPSPRVATTGVATTGVATTGVATTGTWRTPGTTAPVDGPVVRVLYLRPTDRPDDPEYAAAIASALRQVQGFYEEQLDGVTFTLAGEVPERCDLPNPADYYTVGSWGKVVNDVQPCAPVSSGSAEVTWVLYVDVMDRQCDDPQRLGAGAPGLTILPRADLEGLLGRVGRDACGGAFTQPVSRWVGGLGHELGHAFGLSHPPGCDAGTPECDNGSMMGAGYANFPATSLRPDDRSILLASPFFRREPVGAGPAGRSVPEGAG